MNVWSRWPSVDRSPSPAEWRWPANLMAATGSRRWPHGRVAVNQAEEILSTAEAWWDVERSGFRDGDRWLRNIGQAGSVLDLRLGSTAVANSNDPLFLPVDPAGTGYIYLSGVAGNSISCTAPASAASYSAVPVGGATATTGSVTGGAAFTFSTAGSWSRVDLLDAGSAVVASFNGDALSGSSTSQTDAYSVAWTINRSTSGRKSVAMPSRSNGGKPCFLLGTDDYLQAQDAAQHGLLNFYGGDSFTILAVTRRWATGTGLTFAKRAGATTGIGWNAYATGTAVVFAVGDQSGFIPTNTNGTLTYGSNAAQFFIRNRVLRIRIGTLTPADSTDTTTHLANTQPFRVGVRSDGSTYADMEFQAVAVWRRALTAREISVINTAAIWGT